MRSGGQGVSVIHTDYVSSKELSEKIRSKRRRGLIRRLMAFFILLSLMVGSLYSVVFSQQQKIQTLRQQKSAAKRELAKVTSEQQSLSHQVSLLHNDEYIGDLARQKYFMSKKGEIIFASPKTSEH
ncbi:septum formation initiator family protein [Pullulanibacillus sp. KACC 23026]|uniref:FtsB family cell division protein n=1 Tax=Pullulanibacillus sp. KACC 23026 TaxID=3028315 RepID=UPI0023B0B578|nr:septum formation initiator family protein [Pullulanibacillus sp. KACC 23026]WEG12719.1 septum formation initiator family protein [Pullulanibacillus sp. KACC 23026]